MTSNLAIVGTGYVGLSTAISLAQKGYDVTCVDQQSEVVECILRGESPYYEPGFSEALLELKLKATTDLKQAIVPAETIFLCVGTPTRANSDEADLSHLEAALIEIGQVLAGHTGYKTIVIKSTVPPGTTDTLARETLEKVSKRKMGEKDHDFGLAMVPEFLREGSALEDSHNAGRIVIGAQTLRSRHRLAEVFSDFNVPLVFTNPRTAEICKYMTNGLLATLISFANEFSNFASVLGGIDLGKALEALSYDRRFWPKVGKNGGLAKPEILSYLFPGCGFGGSCFAKDLRALLAAGKHSGIDLSVMREALQVNEQQSLVVISRLEKLLDNTLANKCIGIYGLSFKPETDDVRESPASRLIDALLKKQARVIAHDPVAMENYRNSFSHSQKVIFAKEPVDLFSGTDAVLLVTPWPRGLENFYDPNLLQTMKNALIVDCRGSLSEERMRHLSCRYVSPLTLADGAMGLS